MEGLLYGDDHDSVCKDVAWLENAWSDALTESSGSFLVGFDFGGLDPYYASIVMRLHYYKLPASQTTQSYMDRDFKARAVEKWLKEVVKQVEFFDFEEPYRLGSVGQHTPNQL